MPKKPKLHDEEKLNDKLWTLIVQWRKKVNRPATGVHNTHRGYFNCNAPPMAVWWAMVNLHGYSKEIKWLEAEDDWGECMEFHLLKRGSGVYRFFVPELMEGYLVSSYR